MCSSCDCEYDIMVRRTYLQIEVTHISRSRCKIFGCLLLKDAFVINQSLVWDLDIYLRIDALSLSLRDAHDLGAHLRTDELLISRSRF